MIGREYDFAAVFDVDFDTGVLTWREPPKNHAEKRGQIAGFLLVGQGKNKSYWMVRAFSATFKRARVVFYMKHGRWPTPAVDHADGNSLNDGIANLRECSLSQNAANSALKTRRHDLPRGVYLTRQGRFMARLTQHRITRSLGVFDTVDEAASTYASARKEAFGEFA